MPAEIRPDRRRRPLVVVSNRLPYDLPKGEGRAPKRNVGGLVNALEPVLVARGGTWVGWDGAVLPTSAAVLPALANPRSMRLPSGVNLSGVPLADREIQRYYHGLANRTLWPLFHDFPDRAVFSPEDWAAYELVNRRFAEVALARTRPGDRVWVHDFHLMLVPLFLRELGFKGRIDFFLHIPFPPAEIYRALPWREQILRGVLAADAVAFQIPRYRDNFAAAAESVAAARVARPDPSGRVTIEHETGATAAVAEAIGIDVDDFERIAASPSVRARARRIRSAYGDLPILFGAERLDYTKGVLERFLAFERFLEGHPGAAGRVVMVQIVVPSRHQVEEYRQMKREIERHVGRINGLFGSDGWMPIHYRSKPLDREELVAHYLAASAAVVSPLRDGMNLVAPEFVASRGDDDGVLVLSEFAGVADRLPGALLVNPNDLEGFARAIARALAMPPGERRERMARMRPSVLSNPATGWARRCLEGRASESPIPVAEGA